MRLCAILTSGYAANQTFLDFGMDNWDKTYKAGVTFFGNPVFYTFNGKNAKVEYKLISTVESLMFGSVYL